MGSVASLLTSAMPSCGDGYQPATPEHSIGQLAGFRGNFGVLVRIYTYIRTLGAAGIRSIIGIDQDRRLLFDFAASHTYNANLTNAGWYEHAGREN